MEVPTGPRSAPNGFSAKFYPRWDVRPTFSLKIVSENRKNSKKSFRSLSLSKQEKKARLESDFSNLVKKILPGFRLFPDIILMDTIVCPPPSPVPCPPFRLFPDLILMDTIVCPPPSHARPLPPLSSTAADSGTSRYACHHKRGTAWTLHFVSPRAFSAPARLIIFEMLWFLSTSRVTCPTHAESPQYRNSINGNVTFRRHRRQNFILLVSGSTRVFVLQTRGSMAT